jgi:hypothetical protein
VSRVVGIIEGHGRSGRPVYCGSSGEERCGLREYIGRIDWDFGARKPVDPYMRMNKHG